MTAQFITNDKGEKTAVIVPLAEYEDMLHQHHLNLELTNEYKSMIDKILAEEASGNAQYISLDSIKNEFSGK